MAKKQRRKFPCALGCHKKFVKLKQHYMSKAHKMTPEDAWNLVDNRQRPARNKEGSYRRLCSIPGCNSKTVRIADHIRRYHPNLTAPQRREAAYLSKRKGGTASLTTVSKEPPNVADPLSPARSTPRRSSQRLAQPSQPGGLAGSPSPVDRRSIPDTLVTISKKLFPLVKRFWTWQMSHLEGGRSQDMGDGRVVRWCWVNFQCRGVLQFGLQ